MTDLFDTETLEKLEKGQLQVQTDAKSIVEQQDRMQIVDDEDAAKATDFIKLINARIKTVEDERTKITKPLNATLRNVNALFKTISDPLKWAKQSASAKLGDYIHAKEEVARKEAEAAEAALLEKAAAAEEEGNTAVSEVLLEGATRTQDLAAAATPAPRGNITNAAAQTRRTIGYTVTDINRVPAAFLTVDEVALRKWIREQPDKASLIAKQPMAGIEFFEKRQTVVT